MNTVSMHREGCPPGTDSQGIPWPQLGPILLREHPHPMHPVSKNSSEFLPVPVQQPRPPVPGVTLQCEFSPAHAALAPARAIPILPRLPLLCGTTRAWLTERFPVQGKLPAPPQDEPAIFAKAEAAQFRCFQPQQGQNFCSVVKKQSVAGEALITQCSFPAEVRLVFNQCLPSFLSLSQSELLKAKAEVNVLPVQSSWYWRCTPRGRSWQGRKEVAEITSTSPSNGQRL